MFVIILLSRITCIPGLSNCLGKTLVTLANILGILFRVDFAIQLSVATVIEAKLDRVLDIGIVLGVVNVDAFVTTVQLLAMMISHVFGLATANDTGTGAINPAVATVVSVGVLKTRHFIHVLAIVLGILHILTESIHVHHHRRQCLKALLTINRCASLSDGVFFELVNPRALQCASDLIAM